VSESTTDPALDVVGIGNALVDVISHESLEFLAEHSLAHGSMQLIDDDVVHRLYDAMSSAVEISGGSAANTIVGVAGFGGRAAYVGKVAADQLGEVFAHDLRATGVHYDVTPALAGPGAASTGRCLVVVTPDAERTMSTYLGVSGSLGPDDVDPDLVGSAAVVYLEGYLFDRPEAKDAFRFAADVAHDAGRRVALTLSDGFCVERHRAEFQALVEQQVDVLFANESEICSLWETPFDEALQHVRKHCHVAALTRSEHGSVVVQGDEVHVVDASPVDRVVDTTGAGDLYVAGFLHGLTTGLPLVTCARLGSVAAAEVISHTGARPEASLSALAARLLAG
jgi:sugar/nucleoside kinase (ribokinase family)